VFSSTGRQLTDERSSSRTALVPSSASSRGGEAAVVQEVFDWLSDESCRQRFAGAKPVLSARDLEL
jgi:hypothetical protein